MEVIEFFQFAERRAARGNAAQDRFAPQTAVGDRWAQLHTESPIREIGEVVSPDLWQADFWNDLQFRLAYPTHRLRAY
ncbi:hypothetical protein [Methylocapsa palsarum]|uniref:Uncharacterized protein n=1 Tax=Methylocapsa palsarum TaxID=1612308 RepID=A0A1I3WS18_9HYPH|nr:hypothetical protein [Methylocapsa palsarum]SFK10305.1 hypothetical protein SAMN05444581_102100 [Methylocapsa palsarum]